MKLFSSIFLSCCLYFSGFAQSVTPVDDGPNIYTGGEAYHFTFTCPAGYQGVTIYGVNNPGNGVAHAGATWTCSGSSGTITTTPPYGTPHPLGSPLNIPIYAVWSPCTTNPAYTNFFDGKSGDPMYTGSNAAPGFTIDVGGSAGNPAGDWYEGIEVAPDGTEHPSKPVYGDINHPAAIDMQQLPPGWIWYVADSGSGNNGAVPPADGAYYALGGVDGGNAPPGSFTVLPNPPIYSYGPPSTIPPYVPPTNYIVSTATQTNVTGNPTTGYTTNINYGATNPIVFTGTGSGNINGTSGTGTGTTVTNVVNVVVNSADTNYLAQMVATNFATGGTNTVATNAFSAIGNPFGTVPTIGSTPPTFTLPLSAIDANYSLGMTDATFSFDDPVWATVVPLMRDLLLFLSTLGWIFLFLRLARSTAPR